MQVVGTTDVFDDLAKGQRVGQMRRALLRTVGTLFSDIAAEMQARQADVERGSSTTGAERRAAWTSIVDSTATLAKAQDLLAQIGSLDRLATEQLGAVVTSAARLGELAELGLPDALLPPDLRSQLDAITDSNPEHFARTLLSLDVPSPPPEAARSLGSVTRFRFKALHALVLGAIADIDPAADAATESELAAVVADARARVNAVRDAARNAAKSLGAGVATPGFELGLWGTLFTFEQWVETNAADRLAAVAAAATARVEDGAADAERWAREAAEAYDLLRVGLAYDAGIREGLLTYALHDGPALSAFAKTAGLPTGSATTDLPRTPLGDVADLGEGTAVEVAGVVSAAEFRVGGPSNRSVLTLGASGAVRVLVPHVAVDSFGIAAGVWLQARGTAHPSGKDGIPGPVVMAARIRREEAAAHSFADALIFQGRALFDLRPGGLDLVAGRVAGDLVTFNETGRR